VSVASFIAAVKARQTPTRAECLDACDALDTRAACLISEPGSAAELVEARAKCERAVAAQLAAEGDAKRWAERVGVLESRLNKIRAVLAETSAKPLREQFSPGSLPPPTGFVHGRSEPDARTARAVECAPAEAAQEAESIDDAINAAVRP
jgi:hypothetical protein